MDGAAELAMAKQLVEHAAQALQNPDDDNSVHKMANTALVAAMHGSLKALKTTEKLKERMDAVEAEMEDKIGKEDAERMVEELASKTQQTQRKDKQEVLLEINKLEDTMKTEIKALKAALKSGTKRGAAASDGAGTSAEAAAPAAKRPRYEAHKYSFIGAHGQETTMEQAEWNDIKDLYRLLNAAMDGPGRIQRNQTLTRQNLKDWNIVVNQERVPLNNNTSRYIYLNTFMKEGKNKLAHAMLATGELEDVHITP